MERFGPYLAVLLIMTAVFSGCATKQALKRANAALEEGDYMGATQNALAALERKADNEEAQHLLTQAYQPAIEQAEAELATLAQSENPEDLGRVVQGYEQLVDLNDQVERLSSLETPNYAPQLDQARLDAAAGYYRQAIEVGREAGEDRVKNKQAALLMKQCQEFVPGYEDAPDQYQAFRARATTRLAVVPFSNNSGQYNYGAIEQIVADQVISKLNLNPEFMEFVEVVSLYGIAEPRDIAAAQAGGVVSGASAGADQSQGMQLGFSWQKAVLGLLGMNEETAGNSTTEDGTTSPQSPSVSQGPSLEELIAEVDPHLLLVGQISQVLLEPPQTSTVSRTEKEEVTVKVVKEPCQGKPDKTCKREIKAEVQAAVTQYTLKATTTLVSSYQIIDADSRGVRHTDNVTADHTYVHEWVRFRGDERALSYTSKQLKDNKANVMASQSERLAVVLDELSNHIVRAAQTHVY